MDIAKIKELIAELETDIKIRQEALQGLWKLLPAVAHKQTDDQSNVRDSARPILFTSTDSYVDLAVKVITANDNRPMPMKDIAERIRILKNNPNIERRSIEATLTQHAANKGEQSRVMRVGRGIWGVRRFPRETSSVA